MTPVYPGHLYELDHLDGTGKTMLQFVQRLPLHSAIEGVTNQEVLRAVINRVQHLNGEVPWRANDQIIFHLRMALVLHECRALERHVEKHGLAVESLPLGKDGHFAVLP